MMSKGVKIAGIGGWFRILSDFRMFLDELLWFRGPCCNVNMDKEKFFKN